MDTIHDLGGREGFGPVRWQDDDDSKLFHEAWQARTWGICMLMFDRFWHDQTGWTLDWARHVLERIAPADYLAMNYFDKWTQAMMATLIDDGVAEIQEFVEGHSHGTPPRRAPTPLIASVEPRAAKYAVGDPVVAKRGMASMHTRLPGYVRGRKGVIDSCHGANILADASAAGDIREEQLYTVRFEAAELWSESEGRRVGVYIDLWESYLEPA
jgi:nitrile hydratase subunit beta